MTLRPQESTKRVASFIVGADSLAQTMGEAGTGGLEITFSIRALARRQWGRR